jgi:Protein of unknown function (DUF2845)
MIRRWISSLVFAALLAFSMQPASADTLRCKGKLIDVGSTKGEVLAKCGEPSFVENVEEPVRVRRPNGTTYVVGTTNKEIWTYKRAPGKFPAVLTFDGSTLKSIDFIKSPS